MYGLLIALATVPVMGWAVVWIVRSLVMGELDLVAGVIALAVVGALAGLTVRGRAFLAAGALYRRRRS